MESLYPSLSLSILRTEVIPIVSPEEKRRRRIQELAQWCHDAPEGRSVTERVVGKAGYLWGCKIETVREYLGVLEAAALIAVDGERILWVGKE